MRTIYQLHSDTLMQVAVRNWASCYINQILKRIFLILRIFIERQLWYLNNIRIDWFYPAKYLKKIQLKISKLFHQNYRHFPTYIPTKARDSPGESDDICLWLRNRILCGCWETCMNVQTGLIHLKIGPLG